MKFDKFSIVLLLVLAVGTSRAADSTSGSVTGAAGPGPGEANTTQTFTMAPVTSVTLPQVPTPGTNATLSITSATTKFSEGWRGDLERVVAAHRGVMGLSLKNLTTGEEVSINGAEPFPTASTIKTAVMCTAMDRLANGKGPFKTYYDTIKYDAATSTSGSGFIQNYRDGTKLELKELLHLMITVSDNIGTNMLTEWMGGPPVVDEWLAEHGFKVTRMISTIGGRMSIDSRLRREWGLGITTPDEMRNLFEMIATGKAGTTSTTDEMLRLLSHQYFDGDIAAQVPPGVWVGSKSGALNASRSDNAIVFSRGGTYVLSVYTKDNVDRRWTNENEAERAIQKVARLVYKHFNPADSWEPPPGTDKF